eukprot:scaffold32060_cov56-Attheya_sp.AAC.3
MSSPNIRAARLNDSSSQTATFIPKEQIPVSYRKSTIYIYPLIKEGMSNAEKSYAYMTNKAAILMADIHPKVKLQAFGNSTSCNSYYSQNGLTIPDCLDVDGDMKEIDGLAAADRHPANIQFARLSNDIRFSAIDKDNKQPYPFSYFVCLPMELEVVQDDQGNDVHLHTFQGDGEWATDDDKENLDIILQSDSSIGKPFSSPRRISRTLMQTPLGITQQQIDDKTGETVTLSVRQYHNAILNCANFFPQEGAWEVDVVQHFQAHLIPAIKLQMKSIPYNYISTPEKKTPYQQMGVHLQLTFSAATTAETALETVRSIAKQEYTSNHALYSKVMNHSTAEKTIARYMIKPKCWGCLEEGHSYAKKDDKVRDIIICPNKDKKGVTEQAEKGRAQYNAYMKKKRGRGGGGTGKRKVNALLAKFTDSMDNDEVEPFLTSKSPSKAAKNNSSK